MGRPCWKSKVNDENTTLVTSNTEQDWRAKNPRQQQTGDQRRKDKVVPISSLGAGRLNLKRRQAENEGSQDKEIGEADVAWGHQPVATTQLRWVRQ